MECWKDHSQSPQISYPLCNEGLSLLRSKTSPGMKIEGERDSLSASGKRHLTTCSAGSKGYKLDSRTPKVGKRSRLELC